MSLEQGIYPAKVVQFKVGESSKGNECVALQFEILDPAHAGEKITWYGYFSDKATELTLKALRTCGWTGDDIFTLEGVTNNEVDLVLDFEEYEGKRTLKVKWVNAPNTGPVVHSQLTPAKAAVFAARMRAAIAQFDTKTHAAPKPKVKPTEAEIDDIDDSIPF